ncbi:hypothetical protein [Streptomyces sp. SBT349]|uniref:hypothetical protein n=1 Tax=Streptomyces sp. SBT349 TaxID=1580539 RepID=UPI00066C0131|nr:hypothetical protein [Streptomyces sp. SBT349]
MTSPTEFRRRFVERLGIGPAWRDAFLDVPREDYLGTFTVRRGTWLLTYRPGEEGYLRGVYEDTAVGDELRPSHLVLLLDALPAEGPLHHVGPAEGYTRALVADRLGARAPFDGLLATEAVERIPEAWRQEVRPGGVIAARLGNALVALTVGEDGGAEGPLLPGMVRLPPLGEVRLPDAEGRRSSAVLPDPAGDMPRLLCQLARPNVEMGVPDGTLRHFRDRTDGSWARLVRRGGGAVDIDSGGPRDLIGELTPLLTHWAENDRPGPGSYGLTIHPDGHHTLWFTTPDGPRWPLT